jgi:hypothetical protein
MSQLPTLSATEIVSERLLLRKGLLDTDREGLIELETDPEVQADELPDQPVVLVTQAANKRAMKLAARLGFRPISTFEEFGAEKILCTPSLSMFKI